jgi:glycosyltransferase involved in cell wall biosynthesis
MISVLVPLYNYNAYPLAKEIVNQALKLNIEFEFICIDDASKSPLNLENEKINSLANATFIAQKNNAGHRANRNNLAAMAKYKNLLFIDGDSVIISEDYIKNYVKNISDTNHIIYGGRVHPKTITSANKKLRWKYGLQIEDKLAKVRNKNPYKSLMFHNTLIKKEQFNNIKFDNALTDYGHDDTVFSYKVSLAKLNVKHIDNQVEHGDIDDNNIFLKKTREGILNLHKIYNEEIISVEHVRLLNFYSKLKSLGLTFLFNIIFKLFHRPIEMQLLSKNPSLLLFTFYKLSYLCYLDSKNK